LCIRKELGRIPQYT